MCTLSSGLAGGKKRTGCLVLLIRMSDPYESGPHNYVTDPETVGNRSRRVEEVSPAAVAKGVDVPLSIAIGEL